MLRIDMPSDVAPPTTKRSGEVVVIEYLKSQHFRVVHADGAIGGPTPSGQVHLAVFSERPAIPRRVVAHVTEGGALGDPIAEETVVRDGMVREIDVDVMMSLSAAEEIGKLLARIVADTKKAMQKNRTVGA
jgi:hypothetical protein